jgi:hypothetical protein
MGRFAAVNGVKYSEGWRFAFFLRAYKSRVAAEAFHLNLFTGQLNLSRLPPFEKKNVETNPGKATDEGNLALPSRNNVVM